MTTCNIDIGIPSSVGCAGWLVFFSARGVGVGVVRQNKDLKTK